MVLLQTTLDVVSVHLEEMLPKDELLVEVKLDLKTTLIFTLLTYKLSLQEMSSKLFSKPVYVLRSAQ